MDKSFYIITDIDSTFDGSVDDFNVFNESVERLEEVVGDVSIYFASGTSSEHLKELLKWLEEYQPSVYSKVKGGVVADGYLSKNSTYTKKVMSSFEEKKVKACDYLLYRIGVNEISGIVYMGDNKDDVEAMNYIKNFSDLFPFGTYGVMPANSKYHIKPQAADCLARNRRIKGCAEGLDRVTELITDKLLKDNSNTKN